MGAYATPMFLIDGWPDGYVEERAWVEVTSRTDTEQKAISFLEGEFPSAEAHDDPVVYVVDGTSWQRPTGFAVPGNYDLRSERPLDTYGPCLRCGGEGKIRVIEKLELSSVSIARHEELEGRMIGRPITERNRELIARAGGRILEEAREDCAQCYGTGKQGEWIHTEDGSPWESCDEQADEAMLFWNISLAPAPDEPDASGEHGRVSEP